LREIRDREVQEARLELARADAALEELLALREEMRATKRAIRRKQEVECAQFEGQMRAGDTHVSEAALFQDRLAGLQQDIEQAEAHVREITERIEDARNTAQRKREALQDALTQKKAFDEHHRKWQQEQRKAAEKREWEEMDPLAVHQRKRDGGQE